MILDLSAIISVFLFGRDSWTFDRVGKTKSNADERIIGRCCVESTNVEGLGKGPFRMPPAT